MRPFLAPLLITLFLAGCSGAADEPTASSASTRPPPPPPTPSSPAMEANASTLVPPALVEERVSWNVTFPPNALVCADVGDGPCLFQPIGEFPGPYLFPMRNASWARLVMSWNASSPLNEQYEIGVFACAGEKCEQSKLLTTPVGGPSPVVLEQRFEPAGAEYDTIAIAFWGANQATGPLYARVNTEQAFHVEGIIRGERAA